eukprot:COSAG04_NODE_5012_length_1782_cov_1.775401_1_plen_200_part_00
MGSRLPAAGGGGWRLLLLLHQPRDHLVLRPCCHHTTQRHTNHSQQSVSLIRVHPKRRHLDPMNFPKMQRNFPRIPQKIRSATKRCEKVSRPHDFPQTQRNFPRISPKSAGVLLVQTTRISQIQTSQTFPKIGSVLLRAVGRDAGLGALGVDLHQRHRAVLRLRRQTDRRSAARTEDHSLGYNYHALVPTGLPPLREIIV